MKLHELYYSESTRSDLIHVVRRGCGLSPWTLSWDDTTIFKPMVPPVEDGDARWCMPLPGLIRAVGGANRISFLDRPADWRADGGAPTPYRHVRRVIRQRLEAGDERYRELDRPDISLPEPRPFAAVQGALYMRGLHDFCHEPRLLTCLLLPPSAWRAMEQLFADPAMRDDLLDPASPTLIEFYQAAWHEQTGPRWRLVHEVERMSDYPCGPYGAGRFLARLIRPVDEAVPVPSRMSVKAKFVPWATVIHQLTVHEQLGALAMALGPTRSGRRWRLHLSLSCAWSCVCGAMYERWLGWRPG